MDMHETEIAIVSDDELLSLTDNGDEMAVEQIDAWEYVGDVLIVVDYTGDMGWWQ